MAKFTRKHYVAMAQLVQKDKSPRSRRDLALDLADMFQRGNPSFNRIKFLEACGVEIEARAELIA